MTRKNHYGALHTDGETEGKEAQSIRNEGGATETEYRNLPGSPAVKALRFQCRRARVQSRVRKLSSHMPCSMAKKKKKKTPKTSTKNLKCLYSLPARIAIAVYGQPRCVSDWGSGLRSQPRDGIHESSIGMSLL